MATTKELKMTVRLFLKAYRWRENNPIPWTPLTKPLSECRVALVSSAGFVPPGQAKFDESVRGGDSSFRIVPKDTKPGDLADSHRSESFDHTAMEADPDLAFPLTRIMELEAEGFIGQVAPRHLSYMGSITAPGNLMRESAPAGAAILVEDQVDLVLLVPV
ncbi:MAG: D-proline reductase (dithiol) PrdB [Bacteroidia bacterium]|jgi:D-proline reductase (dithiol) PrdB